jgi:hypothetical protein
MTEAITFEGTIRYYLKEFDRIIAEAKVKAIEHDLKNVRQTLLTWTEVLDGQHGPKEKLHVVAPRIIARAQTIYSHWKNLGELQ